MNNNISYRHGIIGCGNMGQIILHAILRNHRASPRQILVSRRSGSELRKIHNRFLVDITPQNHEVAASSQVLWLGVKPFHAEEVLAEVKEFIKAPTVVVSMMTGVPIKLIRKYFGRSHPVLRIMPNTPALLGEGVTGAFFTKGFPVQLKKELTHLLEDLGEVVLLKSERQFDVVTGLSGSGPAFIYSVAEGMIAGGTAEGLSQAQARALTLQTLQGATAMLKNAGEPPKSLISQVASRGGTTEAGLRVLKKKGVAVGLKQAVRAATRKAREIGKKLK